MITNSGCFGGGKRENDPIDDLKEASQVVDDIVSSASVQSSAAAAQAAVGSVAMLVGQYARMVRLLAWAVLAMAAVLVAKEL